MNDYPEAKHPMKDEIEKRLFDFNELFRQYIRKAEEPNWKSYREVYKWIDHHFTHAGDDKTEMVFIPV